MIVSGNIREPLLLPVAFGLLNPLFAERHKIPIHMWVLRPVFATQKYSTSKCLAGYRGFGRQKYKVSCLIAFGVHEYFPLDHVQCAFLIWVRALKTAICTKNDIKEEHR